MSFCVTKNKEVLIKMKISLLRQVAGNRPLVLPQDAAPAPKSHPSKTLLAHNGSFPYFSCFLAAAYRTTTRDLVWNIPMSQQWQTGVNRWVSGRVFHVEFSSVNPKSLFYWDNLRECALWLPVYQRRRISVLCGGDGGLSDCVILPRTSH